MTEIYVDRDNLDRIMKEHLERTDIIDEALGRLPAAVDGGIASAMIGFLVSAGAEATGLLADSYRALAAITLDVVDDFTKSEEEAQDELGNLQVEIEKQ